MALCARPLATMGVAVVGAGVLIVTTATPNPPQPAPVNVAPVVTERTAGGPSPVAEPNPIAAPAGVSPRAAIAYAGGPSTPLVLLGLVDPADARTGAVDEGMPGEAGPRRTRSAAGVVGGARATPAGLGAAWVPPTATRGAAGQLGDNSTTVGVAAVMGYRPIVGPGDG